MEAEKHLVQSVLKGNREAFRDLISAYERLVAHIVFRMVHNESDREDICQEVFVKVSQNLSRFSFKSKLSTWIGRIAYNTTLNYLEKKRVPLYDDLGGSSGGETSKKKTVDSSEAFMSGDTGPEDLLLQNEMNRDLHEQISHLPVLFRTVITLYHLEHMSYLDIADIMNLPVGTVKSYLFRARKRLKEQLLEERSNAT